MVREPGPTALGFAEHEETVGNFVSESAELADLRGMLVAEQEDEEEEDLKELIKDMELSDDEALRLREAIAGIVKAEPEPVPDAEEVQPEPTLASWLASAGFAEHEKTIAAYLSVSSQLPDLSAMADDDMAELVDDMELGGGLRGRVALPCRGGRAERGSGTGRARSGGGP